MIKKIVLQGLMLAFAVSSLSSNTPELKCKKEETCASEKQCHEDRRQDRYEELLEKAENAFLRRRQCDEERGMRLEGERHLNCELVKRWRNYRQTVVREEYAAGCYADLYKSPSRPTYATYFPCPNFLNVTCWFDYATDGYTSDGASADITALTFGEKPIRVQDILLASKLVKQGKVSQNESCLPGSGDTFPLVDRSPRYLALLADEKINFLGDAKSWGLNFDISRYLWKRRVVAGVQCPVVYKKHRLKVSMAKNVINKQSEVVGGFPPGGLLELNPIQGGAAFIQRYGQNTDKFLEDVFAAKGFTGFGDSSSGLGDITFFVHAIVDTNRVDNLMFGMRFVAPTAQKRSMKKVWAPELGNGGFFEGALWGSVVMHKHSYFNPHLFLQGNISSSSKVQRRVPHKIEGRNSTANAEFLNNLGIDIPFGGRVQLAAGKSFAEFDSTVANLADIVSCLKITKGAEFSLRVGNIFEKFPLRRSFVDLYYDFRAKLRDSVTCLDIQTWNVALFEKCTAQIEHKVGLEWSYQFNIASRCRLGIEYTFAGQNVPKTFMLHANMNYSF